MEFDLPRTAILFAIPLLIIVGGTLTSPMPQPLSLGVSVGIALFGLFALYVGVKHGEYRTAR
ncbi:DUF7333 family protein [Halegenticoccus tardaugens]|uniref:DUF7333 family protein n=1 Tax=Halegenticoccus tardaugens TaxID=2071624 RepID=UPI00100A645E|nr:hypothetical protein [Halegenticoccus tardaugens]